MTKALFIKYPINWRETRQILTILEHFWQTTLELPKHQRMKGWLKITREINALYNQAKTKTEEAKKELEEEQAKFKKFKLNFKALLTKTSEYNFHKKNINAFETWMKTKKIPKA